MSIFIYVYIYMCVCVCVCIYIYTWKSCGFIIIRKETRIALQISTNLGCLQFILM